MGTSNRNAPFTNAGIRRRFERAASTFDEADFLHRRAMEGLLERLEPMQADPGLILDLGSATGNGTRQLARRFRRSRVIAVDLAHAMLRAGRAKRWRYSRLREVQGEASRLPFRDGVFDMVVANLSPPWFADPAACFGEIARVLVREGLFLFSSLGPDTLIEIRRAWHDVDGDPHVHPHADMHNVGDALLRAGLRDPVLDVEQLTVSYAEPAKLYRELRDCGGRNLLTGRRRTLTGRRRYAAFEERLTGASAAGSVDLSIEFVFGHAWGSGPRQSPQEFRLQPESIGRIRRNL